MRASTDHILASHAGSLPRPDELIEAWGNAALGAIDQDIFAERLRAAVTGSSAASAISASIFPAMASSANRWRSG